MRFVNSTSGVVVHVSEDRAKRLGPEWQQPAAKKAPAKKKAPAEKAPADAEADDATA